MISPLRARQMLRAIAHGKRRFPVARNVGLFLGPSAALVLWQVLPDEYLLNGEVAVLTEAAKGTLSVGLWMALWWLTEAVDVSATALTPLLFLPLVGAGSMSEVAAPYAHPMIFLFLGGFCLSLAMQRWGLHKRIALRTIRIVGTQPKKIVAGFMIGTAFLSMWVSNTATVMMMLPVVLSILVLIGIKSDAPVDHTDSAIQGRNFALSLLLGVAFAASIGGVGTIIGSPPILFLVSFLQKSGGEEISFVRWMSYGVPFVLLMLPITWLLLTRWIYPISITHVPGVDEHIADAIRDLGNVNRGEKWTSVVFLIAVVMFVARPWITSLQVGQSMPFEGLSDTGVAIGAALLLFAIPVNWSKRTFLLDWKSAEKLPWGVLILFGGGLSLAHAVKVNGVGEFIGSQLSALDGLGVATIVSIVILLMIFLTELTSNTATTATIIPILASLSPVLSVDGHLPVDSGCRCSELRVHASSGNSSERFGLCKRQGHDPANGESRHLAKLHCYSPDLAFCASGLASFDLEEDVSLP